ncbi:hypothetical protein TWF718_001197 [Orbilia javanica]|uniref:Uncharacterized protein n=1 Tax=Orbilia javanica TaxID=47235 RepID=A0AAN8MV16_9PEZI
MREPSLHRMLQHVRKNLAHPRRLIHTTIQHPFRIQAGNVKPTASEGNAAAGTAPKQSTKIQASILERSPDRYSLYKAIENLSRKSNQWQQYFPENGLQLALHDLEHEDPPVRVALLASKEVSPLLRQVVIYSFYNVFVNGTIENTTATQLPNAKETDPTLAKVKKFCSVLSGEIGNHPLSVVVGNLHSPSGKLVNPFLVPLGKSANTGKPHNWLAHKTFIVHENPEDIKLKLGLPNKKKWSPVEIIHDIPFEIFQKETLKNGSDQNLRVSTEHASLATELLADGIKQGAHEQVPEKVLKIWEESGILEIPNTLAGVVRKGNEGSDQIPIHIRDFLATLLLKAPEVSKIPDYNTYIGVRNKEKESLVQNIIAQGREELRARIDILYAGIRKNHANPFTLQSQAREIRRLLEDNLLSTSEIECMGLCQRFAQINPPLGHAGDVLSLDDYMALKSKEFNSLRSQMFELGESLNPYIREHRNEFYLSCGLGAATAGILSHFGIDPAISISLFGLMAVVSLRRFRSEIRGLWSAYGIQSAKMGAAFLEHLKAGFLADTEANRARDLTLYELEKQEAETVLRQVQEARGLLLKLAPSLRTEFPEWETPPSSSKDHGAS